MTGISSASRAGAEQVSPFPPTQLKADAVDTSRGYPVGNGSFACEVRGTQPQPERDLQLAMMANDAYTAKGAGPTNNKSEEDLAKAGWKRLTPVGDHLVDAQGNRIPIDASLLHDKDTGFDAAIYQNDQGQYVIAYRGTDNWSLGAGGDAGANVGQAIGVSVDQYEQAINLARSARDAFGLENLAITGHSLGGGLASAAMLAIGAPGATFNAAGLSDDTLRTLGYENPNATRAVLAENGQIRRYNVEGELLTNVQQGTLLADAVGHELRLAKADPDMRNPITLHGGGGDNASYVEAMRQPVVHAPADLPLIFRAHEIVGETKFKLATAAGHQAVGLVTDAAAVGEQAVQQIGDAVGEGARDGRLLEGAGRAFGAVANGVIDTGARAVERAADFAGDVVREGGSFAGNVLREVGKRTGLPLSDVAHEIEAAGNAVNGWVDKAGVDAGRVVDQGGDGIQRAFGDMGTTAEAALDKAIGGVVWAAEKTADGVQWAAQKAEAGAQWAGDQIESGMQWVGDKADAGKHWVSDRLGDFGRFLGGALSR